MASLVQPFRFMDLPPELRVMVYKHIKIRTKRLVLHGWPIFRRRFPTVRHSNDMAMIVFEYRHISCSILSTCRLIHSEASAIIQPNIDSMQNDHLQFIVDIAGADILLTNLVLGMCIRRADLLSTGDATTWNGLINVILDEVNPHYPGIDPSIRDNELRHLLRLWPRQMQHLSGFIEEVGSIIYLARANANGIHRGFRPRVVVYPHLSIDQYTGTANFIDPANANTSGNAFPVHAMAIDLIVKTNLPNALTAARGLHIRGHYFNMRMLRRQAPAVTIRIKDEDNMYDLVWAGQGVAPESRQLGYCDGED